jgi:hypothetical protein
MSLALTAASLDALLQSAGDLPNHLRPGATSDVHILQHFETVTYATTGSPVIQDVVKTWQSEVRNDTSFPHARYARLRYRPSQAPVAFLD